MEGTALKQEALDEIIKGIKELPDDKVRTVIEFFRYLIFTTKEKSSRQVRTSSLEWKHATQELLSLSGIGSSGLGDLASRHDEYLYGKIRDEK